MNSNLRFKLTRISLGLTQRALGALVGLPEYRITLIETGRHTPDTNLKSRLAAVLKKPTFELFDK
jgi:DNA-binding XRE family transcriptional regulator